MKIRKARKEDARKWVNLTNNTLEKVNTDYSKKQIKVLKKKNTLEFTLDKIKNANAFCLIDNGKIIGTIGLNKNRIGGLYLKHSYIKKGLGKKLLVFVENYARKKGIKKVKLNSTKYAYPFYLNQGYKLIKKGRWMVDGTSFTTYDMEKKLR